MKVRKPIIHGRDHLPGGADPIPFFPVSFETYRDTIKATPALWAYWPLSDLSGLSFVEEVAARNMTGEEHASVGVGDPAFLFSYGLQGPILDDPNTAVGFVGKDEGANRTLGTNAHYQFVPGDNINTVLGGSSTWTIELWFMPHLPGVENSAHVKDFLGSLFSVGDADPTHASLELYLDAAGNLKLDWTGTSTTTSSAHPVVEGWNHVAVTSDGVTGTLYLNGIVTGTVAIAPLSFGSGYRFQLGRQTETVFASQYFEGDMAHAAIYTEPLSVDTIKQHAGHITDPGDTEGWVPTSDGQGGMILQPPGVEVTHGDGEPLSELEANGDVIYLGTPVNPNGWHYSAHVETAVLYESSPGRFDVPTMKWVRVPFNTVRILRTWQKVVDGFPVQQWLPEDRGLTEAARKGLMLITAGMEATPGNLQFIQAYFSIEYPVVDYTKLPDDDVPVEHGPIVAYDAYYRGIRLFQPQSGVVTRFNPGDPQRALIGWPFPNPGDEGTNGGFGSDNPFPLYPPNWGSWVRPMHLPMPYPAFSPTDSKSYYIDHEVGYAPAGFGEVNTLTAHTDLPAGATICLQAWQDTPYTLRFSTDHFPNYKPFNINAPFGKRPYLSITYLYDPDDIDHTTGKRNPGS